ncbi:phosphotransferase [Halogeometricum sp. S1BR25-6]|uniref:Phosphotransferase n=1 Tax=Halogeometricum salsisoli TaxID=2950536 RepID=A0ABU2GCC2_9EURY|nr:phosphotransferase [Halogeometricum sp. S1BR25-6]MDS0297934.1 phosphotransferase [Halogeometricum sp. S1BR25-6]
MRYLKASPDGEPRSIPAEPRIQSILRARTSMPVPAVRGVVDDHGALPTSYFLMDALPGERVAYERVTRFGDDALRRLARETGEQLGELHSVPAVDAFGFVGHDTAEGRHTEPGAERPGLSAPRGRAPSRASRPERR